MNTVCLNNYHIFNDDINTIFINNEQTIINTINAHSYIVAKSDDVFKNALLESDILLPDGEGIVLMARILMGKKIKKIAGADIHSYLLKVANDKTLKCFYLGASESTLKLIKNKLSKNHTNITFGFYSPPFKDVFSESDNRDMLNKVNEFAPDILFMGMTAPKQEKWVHNHKDQINSKIICSIGAVFDFIAETKKRAPEWVINLKLEWLYRSFTAWRLTKRYIYSTPLFLIEVYKLKYFKKQPND